VFSLFFRGCAGPFATVPFFLSQVIPHKSCLFLALSPYESRLLGLLCMIKCADGTLVLVFFKVLEVGGIVNGKKVSIL
jgi:hypothetical protein